MGKRKFEPESHIQTSEPLPPISCAHEGCQHPSMARIKMHTGWANLCRMHYDFNFQLMADRANTERSLETVEQMRAWYKQKLGKKRAPGPWWKQEVLDKYERGEHVSLAALELAKSRHSVV